MKTNFHTQIYACGEFAGYEKGRDISMARKTQISKDKILEAALSMLIREGYAALNIKTLASELGCSTQPIAWHFENMEDLRKSLAAYALSYANDKMRPLAENAIEAFEQVGTAYVGIALNEPNLFRFLYLEGYEGICADNFDALIADEDNAELAKRISAHFDIPEENAGRYLQNTIIYTHGIAALAATGVIKADAVQIMQLVNHAADSFLLQEGAPMDRIWQHNPNGGNL